MDVDKRGLREPRTKGLVDKNNNIFLNEQFQRFAVTLRSAGSCPVYSHALLDTEPLEHSKVNWLRGTSVAGGRKHIFLPQILQASQKVLVAVDSSDQQSNAGVKPFCMGQ